MFLKTHPSFHFGVQTKYNTENSLTNFQKLVSKHQTLQYSLEHKWPSCMNPVIIFFFVIQLSLNIGHQFWYKINFEILLLKDLLELFYSIISQQVDFFTNTLHFNVIINLKHKIILEKWCNTKTVFKQNIFGLVGFNSLENRPITYDDRLNDLIIRRYSLELCHHKPFKGI